MATATTFDSLIADLRKQQEKANLANQQRYDQMLAIYDEVIRRYQPGGTFEKAGLAQIEGQKVQDIGKETQQMIGSGLYGTTTTASLPSRWESTVGAKARLNLEDVMMQRLSGAQLGKAGVIENVNDVGPSATDIASLALQYGQGRTGGGYTPSTTWSVPSGYKSLGSTSGGTNYTPSAPEPYMTNYADVNAELAKRTAAAEQVRTSLAGATPISSSTTTKLPIDYTSAAMSPALRGALTKPYTPEGYKTEWSDTQKRWVTWKV